MVEFALTITMTLLLIFGMIDFSRAIYTASIIQWAAQYGARAAIVKLASADDVKDAVEGRLVGLNLAQVTIDVDLPSSPNNVATVTVSYPFKFIVPMVERITGGGIEMRSSASMVAH
jgi:Flp pilus assembly protein TadG